MYQVHLLSKNIRLIGWSQPTEKITNALMWYTNIMFIKRDSWYRNSLETINLLYFILI